MRFESPDDIFWRFVELQQRAGSPRPATPTTEDGWRFARYCTGCHERERVWKVEDVYGSWVCSSCSKPWGVWPAFAAPRGPRRTQPLPGRIDELIRLRRLLEQMPLWEGRLYLEIALWAGIKPYKLVAQEANRRWRRRKPFTEWTARKAVEGGRTRLWSLYSGERLAESGRSPHGM